MVEFPVNYDVLLLCCYCVAIVVVGFPSGIVIVVAEFPSGIVVLNSCGKCYYSCCP